MPNVNVNQYDEDNLQSINLDSGNKKTYNKGPQNIPVHIHSEPQLSNQNLNHSQQNTVISLSKQPTSINNSPPTNQSGFDESNSIINLDKVLQQKQNNEPRNQRDLFKDYLKYFENQSTYIKKLNIEVMRRIKESKYDTATIRKLLINVFR